LKIAIFDRDLLFLVGDTRAQHGHPSNTKKIICFLMGHLDTMHGIERLYRAYHYEV